MVLRPFSRTLEQLHTPRSLKAWCLCVCAFATLLHHARSEDVGCAKEFTGSASLVQRAISADVLLQTDAAAQMASNAAVVPSAAVSLLFKPVDSVVGQTFDSLAESESGAQLQEPVSLLFKPVDSVVGQTFDSLAESEGGVHQQEPVSLLFQSASSVVWQTFDSLAESVHEQELMQVFMVGIYAIMMLGAVVMLATSTRDKY